MRLFLVDDHQVMLDGLRLLISTQTELEIVGTAFNGSVAWTKIAELRPDLVVMDLDLPGEGGVALTARILEAWPETKVVVLTAETDVKVINAALGAGASGFILKLDAGSDLLRAISAAAKGELFVSATATAVFAEEIRRRAAMTASRHALTNREVEIVTRIANGQSAKEIAFDLGLSPRTVEAHRSNLMRKIGANNVAEVIKFALREGLAKL